MRPAPRDNPPPAWDLFCRVVDNYGDAGVCWRLAAELAARGLPVRLFIDDARALAWMAPGAVLGLGAGVEAGASSVAGPPCTPPSAVQVLAFEQAEHCTPAPVVVEAFGCDPPVPYVQAMAAAPRAPVWLNLEYLSAEDYVERSHALPSPQRNGLTKWFFYPGFTPATGGLLREADLPVRQAAFSKADWLRAQGVPWQAGERLVSLFCYTQPAPAALHAVLQALAQGPAPTRLLLTPAAQPLLPALNAVAAGLPGRLHLHALPWLSQAGYDHLLWACDLNCVRGEDSLVRAHWAGQPFLWHIYPQHDGVHAGKLQALLQRMQASPEVAALWRSWNGLPGAAAPTAAALAPWLWGPAWGRWRAQALAWRAQLVEQPDLVTQLLRFATSKRGA